MNKKYTEERPYMSAEIERSVKVEAGHTCSVKFCNEHTYLEIHHIDENRENNKIENLILLCDKHHKMSHAKKITRKELREYKALLNTRQRDDVVEVNNEIYKEFYEHLINFITKEAYLTYWVSISDNLIANSIESDVLDGFQKVVMKIFKTEFPNYLPELEQSILDLAHHFENIVNHFQNSEHAFLQDNQKFWSRDMRWKRVRLPQDEYDRKYKLAEEWRNKLFILHQNIVVALNNYSRQVRENIDPKYFMREQFSVVDSLGTYNMMQPYEMIPNDYRS